MAHNRIPKTPIKTKKVRITEGSFFHKLVLGIKAIFGQA